MVAGAAEAASSTIESAQGRASLRRRSCSRVPTTAWRVALVRRAVCFSPSTATSTLCSLEGVKRWSRFAKVSEQVAVTVHEAEIRAEEVARSIFVPTG